ncbi:uncharacterized protein LOC136036406 isoform X2 [Artemia franciscana]|uniref:Uncharacterized protein n=2 Tax=Artemia franciscana TaxID=6661 RepID=A0AA88LGB5_ARTSF|nr:hypothetical protein QYM36_004406 [Artemia franciscana]
MQNTIRLPCIIIYSTVVWLLLQTTMGAFLLTVLAIMVIGCSADILEASNIESQNITDIVSEPPDILSGRGKASKEVIPRKGVAPISEEMVDLPVPLMANSTEEGRKSSSPRKGAPKEELSKPRKGVETFAATRNDHRKPYEATDSEGLEDSRSGLVALSVGLCIGLLVLCVFLVLTVRNMRKSWNRQQYRRVDFLIDDFDGDI